MNRTPDFEPVTALKELVSLYSLTDYPVEQQALSWAAQQFHRLGIDYQKVPKIGENGQIEEGQYAAIIGKIKGRGRLIDTAIISDGHIDVVPIADGWTKDQGEMDGSIMYGRGTTDMKSGVVAQIEAARQARDFRNLPFDHYVLVVAGEETTGWGTEQAVKWTQKDWAKYENIAAIIPEPTSYIDKSGRIGTKVMFGNKGCFSAQITIRGDTGHAAQSRGRVNSIEVGADIIHALRPLRSEWDEKYRDSGLGLPELTFTKENAGIAPNSLPADNVLRLDGRFPIELRGKYEEDLSNALRTFTECGVDFKILYYANPAYTPPSHQWVQFNLRSFSESKPQLPVWTTDGCFFTDYKDEKREGIPLVIAGPGFLDRLHVVDEMCDTSLILPWAQSFLSASNSYVCSINKGLCVSIPNLEELGDFLPSKIS